MASAQFDFVSVTEAAEVLGLTVGRVRQLLIAEELQGHKLGTKQWAISQRDLKRFQKNRQKGVDRPGG